MKRIFVLLLLFCCQLAQVTFAQTRVIDSLRKKLAKPVSEKEKAAIYLLLCDEKASITPDSLMYYALQVKKAATILKDEEKLMAAEYMIMNAYNKFGLNDTCLQLIERQLKKVFKDPALLHLQRKFMLAKGNILNIMNQTKVAQELFFGLLKDAEKENDIFIQLCVLNGIGWSYQNLKSDSLSIAWYRKGIAIANGKTNRSLIELSEILESNIGFAYWEVYKTYRNKNFLDSAINHINTSIAITRQYEFLGVLASNLGNKALWLNQEKNDKAGAELLLREALEIRNKIGNPYMIILDMAKMGEFYLNSNQPEKGIAICLEGIRNADSANIKSDILLLYELLAKNYKAAGKFKEYGEAINTLMLSKDSISKANATKELSEIQTKYDVQKKETLIVQQKLGLFQRKLLLYGAAAGTLLLLLAFGYRFKQYKQMQKILMEEKRVQNEVAIKDAEEKERKRIAAELHDNLGVQANAILHNSTLLKNNAEDKIIVADLQDTAKEMLHNLRETLWAMKTADVQATDLWLRIINFMKQMGRHYTNIHFKVEGEAPGNYIIPSNKALNIVLVLQEAVNNAVKHAQPAVITAASINDENSWSISISDNGNGFDLNSAKTSKGDNYGLGNMQERATASAITLSINTEAGKGSSVMLTI